MPAKKKTAAKKVTSKKATSKKSDALDRMRAICLALPDAKEGSHFGKTSFLVGKKMFATFGPEKGVDTIALGFREARVKELVATGKWTPYARDKRAVTIAVADVDDWSAMKKLVEESYLLVVER